tara:strand:- start:7399 stop:7782 length:384 start_codon:yes stop_codon:yes gene_type:complete
MPNFFLKFFIFLGVITKGISFNLINSVNTIPKLSEINYIPDPSQISSGIDSISIVKGIANFLPNIDLVGHQVLLSNKELIPLILEKDNIPDDLKKEAILAIIKFSQYGDTFGGLLLDKYYHIVDKIF